MKFTLNTDCIECTGYRDKDGYSRVKRQGKMWQAHRLAWFKAHGEIPKGMYVLHHCDNPPCINVEHLFLGTHKDNMQDMIKKGRSKFGFKKGEKHPFAKLTEKDVKEIKALLAQGVVQARVAEKFGVHQPAISHIKTGLIWKN